MDEKTKLEKYADIQAMVQQEIRTMFSQLYSQEATKYGVAKVPLHRHNGADAPTIGDGSINNFVQLPATESTPAYGNGASSSGTPGVANETLLGEQVIDNPAEAGFGNPANVWVMPIPIIHGFGTETPITFTANRNAGATSGTLTGAWGGTTGNYAVRFGLANEIRYVHLTNSATTATWSPALDFNEGTTAEVVANSAFKGGEAPLGTVLLFVNGANLSQQLWVRADVDGYTDRWWGVDLGLTAY